MNKNLLAQSERILFDLRERFEGYGYLRYKMNKFEEYDLYAKNKDFLISEGVITFTDTNGKLMALKPDVTLSIVKNTKDDSGSIQKLYYDENVYRLSKGTRSFKEITQVGLEAMGDIDDYCIYEVMTLAAQSLICTEQKCILEFSHVGLLSEILSNIGIAQEEKEQVLRCIGEKNVHELAEICKNLAVSDEKSALLREIVQMYGTINELLPRISTLLDGVVSKETLAQFCGIAKALQNSEYNELLRIDFSIVSDIRYYNGFVFRGFAQGIPTALLSGGQYDTLMKKMKKKSGAIGFAVYLDLLEESKAMGYDVDNLLVYDENSTIEDITRATAAITAKGESVRVQKQVPADMTYKRLLMLNEGEVKTVEENA